jgi:hypothetical protein
LANFDVEAIFEVLLFPPFDGDIAVERLLDSAFVPPTMIAIDDDDDYERHFLLQFPL